MKYTATQDAPASQPQNATVAPDLDTVLAEVYTVLRRHPEAHAAVEQLLDFRAATVRER